jgi:hypothetical protein
MEAWHVAGTHGGKRYQAEGFAPKKTQSFSVRLSAKAR